MYQQILDARKKSLGGNYVLNNSDIRNKTDFKEINFEDGEIQSVKTVDDILLKRGMLIKISSRYVGKNKLGVIYGFTFTGINFPIMVSMGGAEGELTVCVKSEEISLLPTQEKFGKAITLSID